MLLVILNYVHFVFVMMVTGGTYNFCSMILGEEKNLVKFVKTVAEVGLYVHLRIGPYVCAEWNYGYYEFN